MMDPLMEMLIYSLIPILFLPIAFGVWFFKRANIYQKIVKPNKLKEQEQEHRN